LILGDATSKEEYLASFAAVEVIAELLSLENFDETAICVKGNLFNILLHKVRTIFSTPGQLPKQQAATVKAQFMKNLLWI